MKKTALFVFTLSMLCVFANGCATGGLNTTEIVSQFRKIDYSDGINAKEAKAIAHEYMLRRGLIRSYGENQALTVVTKGLFGKKDRPWKFVAKPNLDNPLVPFSSRELWIIINSNTGEIEKVSEVSDFGASNHSVLINVPGSTVADKTLQSDIVKNIGYYESTIGGNFNSKIIKTEVVASDNVKVKEIWTVNRNGKEINYIVELTPNPRGGTDVSVTLK